MFGKGKRSDKSGNEWEDRWRYMDVTEGTRASTSDGYQKVLLIQG